MRIGLRLSWCEIVGHAHRSSSPPPRCAQHTAAAAAHYEASCKPGLWTISSARVIGDRSVAPIRGDAHLIKRCWPAPGRRREADPGRGSPPAGQTAGATSQALPRSSCQLSPAAKRCTTPSPFKQHRAADRGQPLDLLQAGAAPAWMVALHLVDAIENTARKRVGAAEGARGQIETGRPPGLAGP